MHCATDRTAGQAGCVESARENPQATTFSILSHAILADPAISRAGKLILLALLKFARQKGECFPALVTLARAAGISESTVRRHLGNLVKAGLLSIRPTKSNPTGRVIVLDFVCDPAKHPAFRVPNRPTPSGSQTNTPLRVSNRPPPLGCQTDAPLRVSNRPPPLGCQTDALVGSVEEKGEKKPTFSPSLQRQRSEASAWQLELIGTIPKPTTAAFTPPRPVASVAPQDEPPTRERAEMIMQHFIRGGGWRNQALKYFTPAMIAFMKAQDGELSAFAHSYSPSDPVLTPSCAPAAFAPAASPIPATGVTEVRITAVMEAVAAVAVLDRRSPPLLVDRLADRLMTLFGDGESRSFFCKIGHALRNGSLEPRALHETITTSFGPGVKNPSALFTSRIGARIGERKIRK